MNSRRHWIGLVGIGAMYGLAWSAGLRGWMTQIVDESVVTWAGTFGAVLLPGVVTGALLGWAEYVRRTGGRRGWRWLALAPMLLATVAILDLRTLLTTGLGGGAIAVPLFGLAGGYAISGRGPLWGRIASGILPLVAVLAGPAMALAAPLGFGIDAKMAWLGVYLSSFLAVLMVASSIPHRAVLGRRNVATVTDAESSAPAIAG